MKRFRIPLLLCLLALGATNVDGQSIETLRDSVSRLYAEGKYAEAIPFAQEGLRLAKQKYGETSADVGEFTHNLGVLLFELGEYERAELLYLKALRIDSVTIGTVHPDFATHLNNLGNLLYELGEFEKAELLFLKILKIDSIVFDMNHPEFTNHLNNLARIYTKVGKYEEAELLFKNVLKFNSNNTVDHPGFGTHHSNLATLYEKKGEYEKAEALVMEALRIDSITFGIDHPYYALHLNNLGSLYAKLGDYEKAEPLLYKALGIDSIVYGYYHPMVADILNNLASLNLNIGDLAKAENFLLEAKKIDSITVGKNHPSYSMRLNNLAAVYLKMKEYEKALLLYVEALKIDSIAGGTEKPTYAILLNNIGQLYASMKEYEKAEALYWQALRIDSIAIGTKHPSFVNHLFDLGTLHMKSGKFSMIKGSAVPAFAIASDNAIRWMNVLSRSQRTPYWDKHRHQFSRNHTYIYFGKNKKIRLAGVGYESGLLEKGILLRSDQAFRAIAARIHSDVTRKKLDNLNSLNRQIQRIEKIRNLAMLKLRTILENQAEALEKELLREVPEFKEYLNELKVTWKEVQSSLGDSSAAIEFVHFPFFDGEKESGYWYGAYILKKGDTLPKFVGLCPADSLQNALGSERETSNAEEYVDQLYGSRGVVPGKATAKLSKKLYDLIWEPLDSLLEGKTTVYFAPAGILHNVAFAALPITESTVLSDRYRLVQMGTTGTLAKGRKDLYATQLENAALFGGMDFDLDSASIRKGERAVGLSRGGHENKTVTLPSGLVVSPWKGLAGTQKECDAVAGYLKSIRIPAVAHTGAAASEGVFGSLEGEYLPDQVRKTSPALIHVATHGFSIPVRPRPVDFSGFGHQVERYHWSEDPLRRAGLIFSGANHVWTGHAAPAGMADGILSAAEVSLMDLSDTRLVVLSACQTGLGDIVGNEGVFGLQRAFKLAGVELVVASLWRVPDKETVEFMELFYGNFVAGMEVREAFRKAQEVMKEKYRGEPYKWAAFVLME